MSEKLTKGEIVDITQLVEESMGSEMFIKEMISIFIRSVPGEVDRLDEAVKAANYDDIYAIAHKIKPNYHYIGLKQPQDLLFEIEELAKEKGSIELIKEKFDIVSNTTSQAVEELGAILQSY